MPAKLTIAEKQEIQRLYCETELSTNQLAQQYGTSSSTILRLLQEMLTPEVYKEVISQKQAKAKKSSKTPPSFENHKIVSQLDLGLVSSDSGSVETEEETDRELLTHQTLDVDPAAQEDDQKVIDQTNQGIKDKAASKILDLDLGEKVDNLDLILAEEQEVIDQPAGEIIPEDLGGELADDFELILEEEQEVIDRLTGEIIPEDLVIELVGEEIVDDEFEEDDEEEDDEEEDDSSINIDEVLVPSKIDAGVFLSVLPLAQAKLPHICYIVVDKISEIVTRPLRDFKDLGKIPVEEMQALTMPVFDNHKIARRFSAHNQKVIKFPAKLINLTQKNLARKGITRLLFNGQIYAL